MRMLALTLGPKAEGFRTVDFCEAKTKRRRPQVSFLTAGDAMFFIRFRLCQHL